MMRSSAVPGSRMTGGGSGTGQPPRWSKLIPWMFVGGFAIVIAVNGALIYFASSSFSGLETDHAYEIGLHYNQSLEAAAAQEKLGWRGEISLSDPVDGKRALTVLFADKLERPIDGLKVEAHLLRPSNAGMDVNLTLDGKGNGRYVSDVALPAPGNWEIRIVARDSEHSWQKSERLFAK